MSRTGSAVRQPARDSAASGFTLLELLIVVGIAALGVSLSLPLIGKTKDRTTVKAAAQLMAADLRWLRERAIAFGRETALVLETDRNAYTRQFDSQAANGSPALTRDVPAKARMDFLPVASGGQAVATRSIRFFPDGTSSGGGIELAVDGKRYEVSVSWPFGGIQVRE